MAMTDAHTDRQGRRRPFSTWVKKLTRKRKPNNNPYPQSGRISNGAARHSHHSISTAQSGITGQSGITSATSIGRSSRSRRSSLDGHAPPTAGGARSVAPTVSTDHEHMSVAGTSRTANGVESRRGDSTFSSPAPSVRSLTTTLTTIQSLAPNGASSNHTANNNANSQVIHFNQPFPTTSPASAIPAHLVPSASNAHHPMTYSSATANNLLTDNASILTLASSSRGRRRRSLDTDASVRALAPSSLFSGSRESLPLSVLSANIDATQGMPATPGLHQARSAAERTSIYSATGGILSSERNSYYAKQNMGGTAGDGASVRSGLLGHGRADSVNGSIGGLASPSLASPKEVTENGVDEKDEDGENDKAH